MMNSNYSSAPIPLKENIIRDGHVFLSSYSLFTSEECDTIVKYGFERYGKYMVPATVENTNQQGYDVNGLARKSNVVFFPTNDEECKWVYDRLIKHIDIINEKYFHLDLLAIESLQFTNYGETYKGFYAKHTDIIRSTLPRKLSFSIQLSDSKDYEGGDLCLYTTSRPQFGSKEKGSGCFFPSFTVHEATPVTKGIRNCLVGWFIGPNFK